MTIHLPTEIRDHIAVINGVPWGFGKLATFSYSGLSNEEKLQYIRKAESFFKDVVQPDLTGCLWLTRKEVPWKDELEEVVKASPLENQMELQQVTEAWLDTIESEGAQYQYEFMFGMEIPIHDSFRQSLVRLNPLTSPKVQRWIRKWTSTSLNDVNLSRFKQIFREKTASFDVENCTSTEIMDFYQQHNYRGLPRPELSREHQLPQHYNFLMPNAIENCGKYIRLESDDGFRYVTFLTVSLYPSQITVPGFDLLYDLQSQKLPVEVQLWWRQKSYSDARNYSERKKKLAASNRQHMGEVQMDSNSDETIEMKAALMEAEVFDKSYPLNMVQLVFCLTAEHGEEELNYYVKMLERYLEHKGINPHRSTADQSEYYDAWCPAAKWSPVGYTFPMLPNRTGALAIPGASDELGDPTGLPKGTVLSNGSIFRLNFSWGARVDQASNVVVVGQTGSGKTHLADDLVRDTLLTTHSRGIYVDVKGEHNNWDQVPGLHGKVQYRLLDGYKNPGMLDPFFLVQRVDGEDEWEGDNVQEPHRLARAREIAYDMILQILDLGQDPHSFARRNDILNALHQVCDTFHPRMLKVIEVLEQAEEKATQEMGQYLRKMKELPLGSLIFGEWNDTTQLQFPQTGLIILGIKNIHLPERGQASVNPSEKVSEACMTGISVMVEQFLIEGKQKGVFSFFVGDEGYFYARSSAGGKQIERNFRLGRSAFCGNILCSQNPEDIPDPLLNHVSTYICLGTKTDQQTVRAMESLGVSIDNEEVFQELKRLGIEQSQKSLKGKLEDRQYSLGYVRDLAQRVGLIKFITPQSHVREFLRTRPDLFDQPKVEEDD